MIRWCALLGLLLSGASLAYGDDAQDAELQAAELVVLAKLVAFYEQRLPLESAALTAFANSLPASENARDPADQAELERREGSYEIAQEVYERLMDRYEESLREAPKE